jgi:RHH-type transcriptional regulator, proline utilization regulon repressor / proline dehydrogenase / delta 1-pyrroline-5-carboxylate dehydrogenase
MSSNLYRDLLNKNYTADETQVVAALLSAATFSQEKREEIKSIAEKLVIKVREARLNQGGLDAFLYQYDLSSDEGIALMCLAEALLRIPDSDTVNKLIRDKISRADWEEHLGKSESLFVNAATWGLMLTGKILSPEQTNSNGLNKVLKRLVSRGGEPLIRKAVSQAMTVLGKQFVMGRTIKEALKRAHTYEEQGYLFSYDMLGEAARTMEDADRYFKSYQDAIDAVGKRANNVKNPYTSSGVSVKLSALHPRYEFTQRDAIPFICERLLQLCLQAKQYNIGVTVDAEEAERLDISLDIIQTVFCDSAMKGWEGFGVAIQSYQKRGFYLIDWLAELANTQKRRMIVRLIKGAYWDAEIKNAQVKGWSEYPVFTRKMTTDVSFIACAKKILSYGAIFYPAFATHNAYSLATILAMVGDRRDFEFQCLHGMGYTLYDQIVGKNNYDIACRVYAPVGGHEDLLAYLVRRLLENGANTSFVNRIIDEEVSVSEIVADPVAKLRAQTLIPHPNISLPRDLYGLQRKNSKSINLSNPLELQELQNTLLQLSTKSYEAYTFKPEGTKRQIYSPNDNRKLVGTLYEASAEDMAEALKRATEAFESWETTPVQTRILCLEKAADLFEQRLPEFMSLAIREGGKTISDALAEVRETIDFCRYYAEQAKLHVAQPTVLPGPTGESNQLFLRGRGPMICISPWNFPLAIFIGQVSSALVTGNTVLAKPAMQTALIAKAAIQLLHEAGVPKDVVQLLPGSGKLIGTKVVADERIKGVIFTGSTETAQQINQTLANRNGAIVPLIAETGGQNAMIVDSSALPEQVVADVINSAFMSAGQRCSALRVLYLQEEVADKTIKMLCGAMAELKVGHSQLIATDIGPVIDHAAKKTLEEHVTKMKTTAKLLYQIHLPEDANHGSFFAPCAIEIDSIKKLTREVFGPVLHIVRFSSGSLDNVIEDINATGYGLTMGIHSRIDETIQYISQRVKTGNIYVNRNMIGAVVGVQPFGGENLSGTGPKAGGPHYLLRMCTERTLTINTTAAGGNASLMSLSEGS